MDLRVIHNVAACFGVSGMESYTYQ